MDRNNKSVRSDPGKVIAKMMTPAQDTNRCNVAAASLQLLADFVAEVGYCR
jgi:hypothetical protein